MPKSMFDSIAINRETKKTETKGTGTPRSTHNHTGVQVVAALQGALAGKQYANGQWRFLNGGQLRGFLKAKLSIGKKDFSSGQFGNVLRDLCITGEILPELKVINGKMTRKGYAFLDDKQLADYIKTDYFKDYLAEEINAGTTKWTTPAKVRWNEMVAKKVGTWKGEDPLKIDAKAKAAASPRTTSDTPSEEDVALFDSLVA